MRVHRSCFFTFLNFFRESEKLLLIFLNESVIIDKHFKTLAGVMELADVLDSKSSRSDTVPVRPRSPAPKSPDALARSGLFFLEAGFSYLFLIAVFIFLAQWRKADYKNFFFFIITRHKTTITTLTRITAG